MATLENPAGPTVDPTRLEVLFTEGSTAKARTQVLANARANGATATIAMFPHAKKDSVFRRMAVVIVPDEHDIQGKVLAVLRASEAVQSAEPTPLRWLTFDGPGD